MPLSSPTAEPEFPVTAFERVVGHPPGLFILFFTEMWERFSYYGMRGLLKLYMVHYLFVTSREVLQAQEGTVSPLEPGNPSLTVLYDLMKHVLPGAVDAQASVIYGWYTGLVYLTPIAGGWLADKYLGQKKTVVLGGVLMALGHFAMESDRMFFFALMLLIVGNGAFKPNISTQVGGLYKTGDPRSERAFSIFYVGINLGAFLSNLACGTLAAVYGWKYGFRAAGIGMIIGLCVYLAGQAYLAEDPKARLAHAPKTEAAPVAGPMTADERGRVLALVALCALNVVFWAVYEQQGNTMQTWADEQTNWPILGSFQIPSTWFQSFNPLMIFLLTPFLNMFWAWQADRGTEPSTVTKMAMGCVILGTSFFVMVAGAQVVGDGKGSMFWPLFCTFMLTVGELYLSPVGLSLVNKAAPARMVSMMMGMWFMSSFFGNIMSGYIGALYGIMPKWGFFMLLAALGLTAGAAIAAFNAPLRKSLGDGHAPKHAH